MAAARLVLAAILLLAAIGKLLDRAGARTALADFDVPPRLARLGAVALPALELAVAAGLVFQPTAEVGAIGATVLFVIFTAGIARVVRAGRAPNCHCFGQLHSAPAGKRTLARNGLFIAISVLAAAGAPGEPLTGLVAPRSGDPTVPLAGTIAAFGLGLLIPWLCSRLLARRQQQQGRAAPARLPVGIAAPPFALPDGHGRLVALSELLAGGNPVMLLFASAMCTQCRAYMPEVARWQERLEGVLRIVPVAYGDRGASHAHTLEHGVRETLFTGEDRGLIDAYATPVTPCAILVDADGLVASAPIEGAPAIEALLRVLAHERPEALPAPTALINRA